MSKKVISQYDIFVKKIGESSTQLWRYDTLRTLWRRAGGAQHRFSSAISRAIGAKVLIKVAPELYSIHAIDFHTQYWQCVYELLHIHAPSGAIIAHEKSMEMHVYNFSIPTRLLVYTRDTRKRIAFGMHSIEFRTKKTGAKTGYKNFFPLLLGHSKELFIEGKKYHILGYESALLDVASIRDHQDGIAEGLMLQFLHQFANILDRDIMGELVQYGYIRAINRVREFAKIHGFLELYNNTLDIIRCEGGNCFYSHR